MPLNVIDWGVERKAKDGNIPLSLRSSYIEPLYLDIEQLILIRLAMEWGKWGDVNG
jgi:hypothetical protein